VSAVALRVQSAGGAVHSQDVPFRLRVANAWLAIVDYLRDSVWPRGLAVSYPYPAERLASVEPYLAFAFVVAVTAACVWLARRRPALAVGWLWFLGTLVPVIGLVQVGVQARADRYTYVPLVGLAIALVFGVLDGLGGRRARPAVITACVAVLTALGVVAHAQVGFWRESTTLYEHAIAVTKDNSTAREMLGMLLLERGDLDAADRHLREALRINPGAQDSRVSLGLALARRGRNADARRELERAVADRPDYAQAHAALGLLADLEHDPPRAAAEYREALRLDPHYFEAVNNLAFLLATTSDPSLRDPATALRLAESMPALRPPDALSLDTLAAAYAAAGRFDEARRTQERALELLLASGDRGAEAEYRARLEAYRAGRPAGP
jgi:Flp pilus assembly protein TadD